jgi:hypothetical protein
VEDTFTLREVEALARHLAEAARDFPPRERDLLVAIFHAIGVQIVWLPEEHPEQFSRRLLETFVPEDDQRFRVRGHRIGPDPPPHRD